MSSSAKLTLALPSKGRLREAAEGMFARAGFEIVKTGSARGYQGEVKGINGLDVAFLSASEIAKSLKDGTVDLGVTGEDLLRETISPDDPVADVVLRLGFGPADVVVAVPECWLDVATIADLDQVAGEIYATHGHRLRVATKYLELTRRFFAGHGLTGYRIVESLGATEGAPAAGSAEIIVDITTTGSTLKANRLKVLEDGLILRSEAVLAGRKNVMKKPLVSTLRERLELAI
ncbi:MAG: ATP phosphoribosyltransferase [Anderseniella sp.]|nr:ATP phosphoribosyltransferase [Anderseniella sp.]